MQGIKTQESRKFLKFFEAVQNEAKKMNSVFFLKNGEGNDIETDSFEGEDLFGWLIPSNKINSFEKEWLIGMPSCKWNEYLTWAEWKRDGTRLIISLKQY